MIYYNYDEIHSALQLLAEAHPGLCTLQELPNRSHEGRPCLALAVGWNRGPEVPTLLAIGGVHAREWVPPDALVSILADILSAASGRHGLEYGGVVFTYEQIEAILEGLQIVVFPCVNPDGRVYSQTRDPMWRKNRRPEGTGVGQVCFGVDINRNFDIAWAFKRHFAPGAVSASDNPCDPQVYTGPSAASEPETQNVVWLLDHYRSTQWFVDFHSAIPGVLHAWGLDQTQSSDAAQTFLNPQYDGLRGRPDDSYREFLPADDQAEIERLSSLMAESATQVAGDEYGLGPAFALYATSGASDDYAYSRHFANPDKAKVFGFTVECGHEFQPDSDGRTQNIREICACLLTLAGEAVQAGRHDSRRRPVVAAEPLGSRTAV